MRFLMISFVTAGLVLSGLSYAQQGGGAPEEQAQQIEAVAALMKKQQGPMKATLHLVNESGAPAAANVEWQVAKYGKKTDGHYDLLTETVNTSCTGSITLERSEVRALEASILANGCFHLERQFAFPLPSESMHLVADVQTYDETVVLEKIPHEVGSVVSLSCGLHTEGARESKVGVWSVQADRDPLLKMESGDRVSLLAKVKEASATAVLSISLVDSSEPVVGGLDDMRRIVYPENKTISVVCEGPPGSGFAFAEVPVAGSREYAANLKRILAAPENGYTSRLDLPEDMFYAPGRNLEDYAVVYFYCRIGGYYGRGVVSHGDYLNGRCRISCTIQFQAKGGRVFAVKD